jgi:hypothetical protein
MYALKCGRGFDMDTDVPIPRAHFDAPSRSARVSRKLFTLSRKARCPLGGRSGVRAVGRGFPAEEATMPAVSPTNER